MKEQLRYDNLREAMEDVQKRRRDEVGMHTWKLLVDHYGEAILFAELASIMSRLEGMFWYSNPWENPDEDSRIERAYDLLIDLGNYADFLYQTIREREKKRAEKTTTKNEAR